MEQCKTKNIDTQLILYKGFIAHKSILDRTIVFKLLKDNEFITHLRWDIDAHKNILFIRKYIDKRLLV